MSRVITMMFALRALLAPSSPAIEVRNLTTPQPEIVKVADAYVKALLASDAAAVKGGKVTAFTLTHTESTIAGDTAYDIGTYSQRLSTPKGIVDETGKYVVMLKSTTGEWKVAYAIHNSDRPPMMHCSASNR